MELGGEKLGEVHKRFLLNFSQTLLTKLCGQDRLLRRIQEDLDKRQEEKVSREDLSCSCLTQA